MRVTLCKRNWWWLLRKRKPSSLGWFPSSSKKPLPWGFWWSHWPLADVDMQPTISLWQIQICNVSTLHHPREQTKIFQIEHDILTTENNVKICHKPNTPCFSKNLPKFILIIKDKYLIHPLKTQRHMIMMFAWMQ